MHTRKYLFTTIISHNEDALVLEIEDPNPTWIRAHSY